MIQQLLRKIFIPASSTPPLTAPESEVSAEPHCCGNVDCGDCDSGRHHWCRLGCTIPLTWAATS